MQRPTEPDDQHLREPRRFDTVWEMEDDDEVVVDLIEVSEAAIDLDGAQAHDERDGERFAVPWSLDT